MCLLLYTHRLADCRASVKVEGVIFSVWNHDNPRNDPGPGAANVLQSSALAKGCPLVFFRSASTCAAIKLPSPLTPCNALWASLRLVGSAGAFNGLSCSNTALSRPPTYLCFGVAAPLVLTMYADPQLPA